MKLYADKTEERSKAVTTTSKPATRSTSPDQFADKRSSNTLQRKLVETAQSSKLGKQTAHIQEMASQQTLRIASSAHDVIIQGKFIDKQVHSFNQSFAQDIINNHKELHELSNDPLATLEISDNTGVSSNGVTNYDMLDEKKQSILIKVSINTDRIRSHKGDTYKVLQHELLLHALRIYRQYKERRAYILKSQASMDQNQSESVPAIHSNQIVDHMTIILASGPAHVQEFWMEREAAMKRIAAADSTGNAFNKYVAELIDDVNKHIPSLQKSIDYSFKKEDNDMQPKEIEKLHALLPPNYTSAKALGEEAIKEILAIKDRVEKSITNNKKESPLGQAFVASHNHEQEYEARKQASLQEEKPKLDTGPTIYKGDEEKKQIWRASAGPITSMDGLAPFGLLKVTMRNRINGVLAIGFLKPISKNAIFGMHKKLVEILHKDQGMNYAQAQVAIANNTYIKIFRPIEKKNLDSTGLHEACSAMFRTRVLEEE